MNLNIFRWGSHERWHERLDAYVDGELPADAVRRFERHLEDCAPCAAALQATRGLRTALASLPSLELPRSFALTEAMVAGAWTPARPPRAIAVTYRVAQATAFAALAGFATLVVVDLGDGGSTASGDDDAPLIQMAADAPAAATAVPTPSGALVPPGTGPGVDSGTEDGNGGANAAGSTETFGSESSAYGRDDILPVEPAEKSGVPIEVPAADSTRVQSYGDDSGPGGLRIVEATLAGLTLVAGMAALLMRRRKDA